MGKRIASVTPRVSLADMIAAGPQPARSLFLGVWPALLTHASAAAAELPRRRGLHERLSGIGRQGVADREVAARLSRTEADFLRDIGAL